ncbi:MAG: ABC transporter permease [Bacteroidales bacterium]|nr:ABC transporter permease [Bacteroidales bacterium]
MGKITLILKREYLTRVKKRSFIIMTILGPLLMAALFVVPVYMAQIEGDVKIIGVVDDSRVFTNRIKNTETLQFVFLSKNIEKAKKDLDSTGIFAVLHIPKTELSVPESAILYSLKQPNLILKSHIMNEMAHEIESLKLLSGGIDPQVLISIKTDVNLLTIRVDRDGAEKKSSTELSMVVGFVGGLLIYIFIFLYGSQVMRGVIEEKTSRIVEVIVSSVKPFELMMGKITGIALVGLTQFALWVLLTFIIVTGFLTVFKGDISDYKSSQFMIGNESRLTDTVPPQATTLAPGSNESVIEVFETINSINFEVIIFSFLFFFIGGYLVYAALFAAIGSAVDNETDTQQFMMPVTIPLILSIVISQFIINNPDGPAAVWLSLIPLTSPVVMMIRIPFGVPYMELALSYSFLILGFIGTTWLAAKIYRTGILMYGKKVTYRELWKWISYRPGKNSDYTIKKHLMHGSSNKDRKE